MSKRVVLSLAAIFLWLAGCGDNKTAAPDASGPTGIVLSVDTATMAIGDTLHVTARYQGGEDPSTIHWASDNAAVVGITGSGGAVTLTALSAGSAGISATGTGGVTATMTITVSPATLLSISTPPLPRLAAGTTLGIPVTAHYSDGSMVDVTAQTTFVVDDTTIATIDAAGTATGNKKGDTQIHLTYAGHEVSTLLTVTDALLVSLAIAPANPNVPLGVSPHLTATGTFSDSSTQDLTMLVAWASSMTSIATIGAATGIVTTVAVGGPTVITATKGAITTTTNLSVIDVALVSIAVTPAAPSIAKGATQQFVATGTFDDSSTAVITAQASWDTDAPAVATMDATTLGLAHGLAEGTANVSATFMGKTGSTLLTVGPAAISTPAAAIKTAGVAGVYTNP